MKQPTIRFFTDLVAIEKARWSSGFFDGLAQAQIAADEEADRVERYRARRRRNGPAALRVLSRLRKVESIDLFKMTQEEWIPDFFGEKHLQFERVKELHLKKARLVWFLTGLYQYLAFDFEGHGWTIRRGIKYSRHRKVWYRLLETHRENVRQQKWDRKRAKVQRRRKGKIEKVDSSVKTLYELRRGLDNNVPILDVVELSQEEKFNIATGYERKILNVWDD